MKRTVLTKTGVLIGLCLCILSSAQPGAKCAGIPDVIQAQCFEIVDKDGNPKGMMMADEDGNGVFSLSDKDGKPRVMISPMPEHGYFVMLLGKKECPRIMIGLNDAGTADVSLYGDNTGRRMSICVADDGQSIISLQDEKEQFRVILTMNEGEPVLCLTDKDGNGRVVCKVDNDGNPMFTLGDPQGNDRVLLGVLDKTATVSLVDPKGVLRYCLASGGDETMMTFSNKDDKSLINFGISADGTYGLDLNDKNEQLRSSLTSKGGNATLGFYDKSGNAIAEVPTNAK